MKCTTHNTEATAICVYCGRAVCSECAQTSATQRMVCSTRCATALASTEQGLQLILQKSYQNARANSFYYYLCGGLSAAGAVGAYYYLPITFLIWFTAGCSVVCIASGFWYGRLARKQGVDS